MKNITKYILEDAVDTLEIRGVKFKEKNYVAFRVNGADDAGYGMIDSIFPEKKFLNVYIEDTNKYFRVNFEDIIAKVRYKSSGAVKSKVRELQNKLNAEQKELERIRLDMEEELSGEDIDDGNSPLVSMYAKKIEKQQNVVDNLMKKLFNASSDKTFVFVDGEDENSIKKL